MDYNPKAITSTEFQELVACDELREMWGAEKADWTDELENLHIVKFPHYITDGPGYSGEVFIILSGLLNTVLLIRKEGKLTVCPQEY